MILLVIQTENWSTTSLSDPLLMRVLGAKVILESYAEVYSNQFTTRNSPLQLVQWSTVPNNNNKKISIWYPSLITRNSSRARQPLSRVNVTELLRRLLVKIENIYLFEIIIIIIIIKHGNVFKNWLCPNFLLLPKKSELPKLWGGCSPPRPPGPYAYGRGNCANAQPEMKWELELKISQKLF